MAGGCRNREKVWVLPRRVGAVIFQKAVQGSRENRYGIQGSCSVCSKLEHGKGERAEGGSGVIV